MTNNHLTDERVMQRLRQFEGAQKEAISFGDDEFAAECSDVASVLREVLARRHVQLNATKMPGYTAPLALVMPDEIAGALIAAIEKEQSRLYEQDYLMDSKDCIDVIREEMGRITAHHHTSA